MISKKRKLFIPVLATTFVTPIFSVTSCVSDLPIGDINKNQQTELLSSEEAKISLLDSWLTTTFTSLYAQKIASGKTNLEQQKISNSLRYFLDYLEFPKTDKGFLLNLNTEVEFADSTLLSVSDMTTFQKLVEEAYKFYVSFNSTVSFSNSNNPSLYFVTKAIEWKKNKYKTNIEIKNDLGKIITINDFNPTFNYNGMNEHGEIIKLDFQLLWSTRGTLIYQNVLKMLLAEMYFLDSNEKLIKSGTNFNKLTKNASSIDYINTMSYLEFNEDTKKYNYDEYLFKKYLVENSPQFSWTYSSTDYSSQSTVSGIVSDILGFNNLKSTNEIQLNDILLPNSTENASHNLNQLQAFSKLSLASSEENTSTKQGDLSIDIDSIKQFGNIKAGLLDQNKNLLFTFTNLESIKKIREYNTLNNNVLKIPSITIKESSKDKKTHSISYDDLSVSWGSNEATPTYDNSTHTYSLTKGTITQKIIITSISYEPSTTDSKQVQISFTYVFNNGVQEYSFNYSFSISNWGETTTSITNQFEEPYVISGNPNQVGIKIFSDEGASIGLSYYLRVLPLFKKKSQILINSSKWYMTGEFTFKSTPWETREAKRKIIYFLMLSDSNLYSKLQDFFLFNNYNISGNVSELNSIVNSLGLNAKTTKDRQEQGII